MGRAIELALKGEGQVNPNLVGLYLLKMAQSLVKAGMNVMEFSC